MNPAGFVKASARRATRAALAVGPIRRVVEGEMARAAKARSMPTQPLLPLPRFIDRHGVEHGLVPTLRDRLKPNWRVMCDPQTASAPPTDAFLRDRLRKSVKVAMEVDRLLAATTGDGVSGRVLEIGCYDGSTAFELSRLSGTSVVASDLARYYVVQRPGQPASHALAEEELALARIRERVRILADRPEGCVTFVEDDITASTLEPGTFDLIVSFEVLEHLARPLDGFAAMARLLRPGGRMYHDYNPFFSNIGGHSLATLDFPWGHVRLDADDIERYLREIRPSEADQALRFYRDSLNRMTQADLRGVIAAAGLELVTVLPWYQRNLIPDATSEVLAQVRATYPAVTLEDLLATFVIVMARKPNKVTSG